MASRKVYVDHRTHGTCITFGSIVYTAPAGSTFDKKADNRIDIVRTTDEGAEDSTGRVWVRKGFNPGCGARCPAELRETPTSQFIAAHSDVLTDTALAELTADQRPAAQMRSTWMVISNDTRKLCILAAQGKLPKRTTQSTCCSVAAPASQLTELDTLLGKSLATQNI